MILAFFFPRVVFPPPTPFRPTPKSSAYLGKSFFFFLHSSGTGLVLLVDHENIMHLADAGERGNGERWTGGWGSE